jgi:hypothetical protein
VEGRVELEPEDRERLLGFVRSLQALLRQLVERRPALVSDRAARLLREAWEELESEERFERFEGAIASGEYDGQLVEHGLYRRQLDMKAGVYESGLEAVQEEEKKLFGFFKKRQGVWKAVLKAANVVLGSAADAIPGGAVVKEFKDGAEAALDQRLPFRKRIRGSFRPSRAVGPVEASAAGSGEGVSD